jgi:RND family efflux transporter MFP subunit
MKLVSVVLTVAASIGAHAQESVQVIEARPERTSRLPGELLPWMQVDLAARVSGIVERVEVDRGSVVKEGQLLVRLAAPEMRAQIAEADAKAQAIGAQRLEAGAKRVAAASTLASMKAAAATPGAVAANEVVLAEKAVEAAAALESALEKSAAAARAQAQALRELESYLEIKAPFDGMITGRDVHPGALASPSSGRLLRLEQLTRLRLVVPVPESDAAGIVKGARVRFSVPAFPGRTFSGFVARVASSMDAKTRTMPVELDVANGDGALAPGMYAEVTWPVRRARASLFVPATSVAVNTEKSFVIRVRNGRAEHVPVSRGVRDGDLVEVFGNLAAGDVVLKRATDEIRDGQALSR